MSRLRTVTRYSVLPLTLYRFQPFMMPKLREKGAQTALGRSAFDFKLGSNNLYNPAEGDKYIGPNGLSMRPMGTNLAQYLQSFSGECIFELPKGLVLPENLVMLHEVNDHYSLQTTKPIKAETFCLQVLELFKKQKLLSIAEMNARVMEHFKQ